MPKLLIVNADDFGLEEEVNAAIVEAHTHGIVRSASLLPNGEGFQHAIELAKRHPHLGIGAHLALTRGPSVRGEPVLREKVPSLRDREGRFAQNPVAFAARTTLGMINLYEVELELRAQLERIVTEGITLTHIDSHQHIHLVPVIYRIIIKLAEAYHVKWVRMPLPLKDSGHASMLARTKQGFLGYLARWNMAKAAQAGLQWTDYHAGIEYAGHLQEDRLIGIIEKLPEGFVEISCHPGMNNERLSRSHPWNYSWEQELFSLCSEKVKAALNVSGARLVNFRDLSNLKDAHLTGLEPVC